MRRRGRDGAMVLPDGGSNPVGQYCHLGRAGISADASEPAEDIFLSFVDHCGSALGAARAFRVSVRDVTHA